MHSKADSNLVILHKPARHPRPPTLQKNDSPVVLLKTNSKRRASDTDPDKVWQLLALFCVAVVLVVAGAL